MLGTIDLMLRLGVVSCRSIDAALARAVLQKGDCPFPHQRLARNRVVDSDASFRDRTDGAFVLVVSAKVATSRSRQSLACRAAGQLKRTLLRISDRRCPGLSGRAHRTRDANSRRRRMHFGTDIRQMQPAV